MMRGLKNVKDHNKKSGADKRSHPYEEELEFMSAKPNIQPECVIGTTSKKETKSSSEESEAGMSHTPTTSKRKCSSPEKSQSSKKRRTNDVVESLEQIMKNEGQRFKEQVERRHHEKMEMFGNFLEILKSSQKK